ncbi:helix-turn-helix domain-containing protein [Streptomyces sp. NPDC007861]|uniref:AraC-like ligand-binding domain-containing protein n=1 Tax=Streptomyces sp. NPDC007861 TaxID=3154893 RepID=UPI0033FFAE56
MALLTELRTTDLPVAERFTHWHDLSTRALVARVCSSDHADDFRATLRMLDLGVAQVSSTSCLSLHSSRTLKLIRRSDPEQYQLALTLSGEFGIEQAGRTARAGPGDVLVYDSSKPYRGRLTGAPYAAVITTQFPRTQLPISVPGVDRLLARRISGNTGIGALLSSFLTRLSADAGTYRPTDVPRLGTVVIDLITTLLAHELEVSDRVPAETHQRALVLRIQAHIQRHLGDPGLTPATIAAAHCVSLRYLHRLFQQQDLTVAAWIRRQRLERCRRGLADPTLRPLPISAIAARWGFTHPAAFSRAFRIAYGMPPSEYRHTAVGPR